MNLKIILSVFFCLIAFFIFNPSFAGDANIGAKLAEKYKCLTCHDRAAKRSFPPVPFLRGQHQRYLVNQLRIFRSNSAKSSGGYKIAERYSHLMDVPAANLSNDDINNLASFFASAACRSAGKGEVKIEEPKLAKSCAFCHGEKGRSPFISYPKIAGQNMGYIVKQLKIMRAGAKNPGERNARFHRTMAPQVIALTDAEIVALGYYYSKQNCR